MLWPLFSPLFAALRQGAQITYLGVVYKGYVVVCFFMAITYLFRKSKICLSALSWPLALISISVVSMIFHWGQERYGNYLVSQVLSMLLFMVVFSSYDRKLGEELFSIASRLVVVNLLFNGLMLLLFRGNYFGEAGYRNFDVSGLFVTYCYVLGSGSYPAILAHLVILFASEKRALFGTGIVLLFLSRPLITVLLMRYPFFWVCAALSVVGVAAVDFVLVSESGAVDVSTLERMSEVYSAYVQLMATGSKLLLGNGFGWAYSLDGLSVEYAEEEIRGYMHFSPAYFHVAFGIVGVLFFVKILYELFRAFGATGQAERMMVLYALSMIVVGFSRLNYFTEPLFMLVLGALFYLGRKVREYKLSGV